MINDRYDIETCTWCNGEGIDQSFKGNPYHQPHCGRCMGSGKVYVTDEMSTTKRRRKYMGPVPKPHEEIAMMPDAHAAIEIDISNAPEVELNNFKSDPHSAMPPKRRGRPPKAKVASGNNPT